MPELKVVEIDRWEVSRLLRTLLRDRHNIRRVCVMVEHLDGSGRSYSNMTAVDRLWWYEAHKRQILMGRTHGSPPESA